MSSSTETNFRRNPKDHQIHDSHPSYDVQNQHESENSPEQSEVADIVDEIPEAEIHQPLIRGFYEGEVLSYHLFTVESSPRMKMDFVVLLQDFLVERTNYLTTMELLKSSKPITKDMYSYVPYESPEDRKISKYVRSVEDKASQNTYKLRSSNTSTSLQKLAQKLLLKLTKPVKRCKKMVKIGGRSMNKMPDGEKYMCMDPDTKLNAKSCLVYAFGIGYDFSFERMMSIFGCRVMAFDDDEAHSKLTSTPFNRVTFIGVRLSLSDKVEVTRMTELKRDGRKSTYSYLYRPLDNILSIAGHEDAILDYLKMDIEGSEWSAFETSIFKSGVLRRTRYLAVEVHLDALINTNLKNSSLLSIQLLRYLRCTCSSFPPTTSLMLQSVAPLPGKAPIDAIVTLSLLRYRLSHQSLSNTTLMSSTKRSDTTTLLWYVSPQSSSVKRVDTIEDFITCT
ncbi:Methyltransferase domain [Trinorchestia longiramus]|nr:Methyltransferase domain [Trinorchestia longiramus]